MDNLTREKRSWNMSLIKSINTKPEMQVRSFLFSKGLRYKVHYKIPGKPDIAFPSKKIAIFVQGCFWHKHNCKYSNIPKTNRNYWLKKINYNKKRDVINARKLKSMGWKTVYIWECDLKNSPNRTLNKLANYIKKQK